MKNKIKFRLREGRPCINATDGSENFYIANEYNSTFGYAVTGTDEGGPNRLNNINQNENLDHE